MAADQYYDAIGETLSYILSAEDSIEMQIEDESGTQFVINRRDDLLDFYALPNKRYFTLIYYFQLTGRIAEAYKNDSELFNDHLDQFDIDESEFSDKNLYQNVATYRVTDVEIEEAESVVTDVKSLATHSDCRITTLTSDHPEKSDTEVWDGVFVSGLLYPYESDFGPREYEQTAQEVISVGNQIDEAMKKLDVMKEIGFNP